jgi:methionyl-tRNA formyltransferase
VFVGDDEQVHVATGNGLLRLDRVQWEDEQEQPGKALAGLDGAVLSGRPS